MLLSNYWKRSSCNYILQAYYSRKRKGLDVALRVLDFDDGELLTLESQREVSLQLREDSFDEDPVDGWVRGDEPFDE